MSEEEWEFFIVMVCAGVIAAAVVVNDTFSVQKFWARLTRSKRPPTPEELVKAHTRHQRFYYHTNQRLFDTTYVSFYLFVLSYIGILVIAAVMIVQSALKGTLFNFSEYALPFSWVVFFFLWSRWMYRQESHHVTAHKLAAILCCLLLIDFVHKITGSGYIEVATLLLLFWMWMMAILHVVLRYEVNYAKDMLASLGVPFAFLYYLLTSNGTALLLFFIPLVFIVLKEFITKTEAGHGRIRYFFPSPLPFCFPPFRPESDSFRKDVAYSYHPSAVFGASSVWEVLFWFSMTPVLLIPVTLYLQSRESQLQQWHDDIITWSENEYVLDPEMVADRLGLTLVDTYPLLNELTEEGKLTLYESVEGLKYGIPPSEEMKAFAKKLNLRKTELPQKDRDLLEYIVGKGRITPPKTVILSVLKRPDGVEVSVEPAGGTISALKSSAFVDTGDNLEYTAQDINKLIGMTVNTLGRFGHYEIKNPATFSKFLSLLRPKGKNLLTAAVPESMLNIEMSHIVLETNVNDIPFELMWDNQFFAVKYAVGRQLRVSGRITTKEPRDIEQVRALIIADPMSCLEEAVTEGDYLDTELGRLIDTYYFKHTVVTCSLVETLLQTGFTIIHYAGHVDENGLPLSDGVLPFHTIQTCLRGRPLVFINGCKSAGIAHTELAEAFLQGGALGYIGSLWDIHDVAAAHLAINFYTHCLSYYTVGEALRMAKEKAFYENNIAWVCFVLFGDPTLQLI